MKVSYNQLQTYFDEKLPPTEQLGEAITFHAFEIESIEKSDASAGVQPDTILDIKVLPDRAGYAKSIDGIAREVAAITGIARKPGMAVAPAARPEKLTVNVADVNDALGTAISADDMAALLARMDIGAGKKGAELVLSIPSDRTDIQDWRDIPEEIGRMYGYEKISPILPRNTTFVPAVQKIFYYCEKIRNILADAGFSEIYGYSLTSKGDYEIEKSIAADKNYLRTNLSDGMAKTLESNAKNVDLLGLLDDIKIFEIGKVFPASGEHLALAFGIKNTKKKQEKEAEKLKKMVDALGAALGKALPVSASASASTSAANVFVCEINLGTYIAELPEPTSYADLYLGKAVSTEYKPFSLQPFIRRDIAVWVSGALNEKTDEKSVREIIAAALQKNAGNLTVKIIGDRAFDTFSKDGKTSYAFGITFQSFDRTLTDVETNAIMEKVYEAVKQQGFEVR